MIRTRVQKQSYVSKGIKKYTRKFYICVKKGDEWKKLPAFASELKSRELALKIEQQIENDWDKMTLSDIAYWCSLPQEIIDALRLRGILPCPKLILAIEGLTEIPISLMADAHIYFLVNNEEVVYVGKSLRVGKRITQHYIDGQKGFNRIFVKPVTNVSVIELDEIERYYIDKYKPKYNINLKKVRKVG